MNRWQQTFDDHQLHETLKALHDYVNTIFNDTDESEYTERRRFLKIIATYQEILEGLDPELVPVNQLDSLNTALRQQHIWNQAAAYEQNGDAAHLIMANDHLTQQLSQLSILMAIAKKTKFTKPFRKIEEVVDQFFNTVTEKKDTLKEEIQKLSASIAERHAELQKLETLIETRKTETDTLTTQWQSQFSEAQERRSVDYTSWREKIDEKTETNIQTLIEKSKSTLAQEQTSFNGQIKLILDDADEKHKAILELYELTAGDSVGAGYIKNANEEMTQANTWRWISIGFIGATVAWLVFVYFCNSLCHFDTHTFWEKIITAFSLTGVLLYGAAFASQQSTKHRNNEKRARWFALEVKAFDPFVSSLPETQRNVLKQQLSERLFGQSNNDVLTDSKVIDEHAYKTIIDGIANIVSKLPKGN